MQKQTVGFGYGVLCDTLEVQANRQGLTLGKKADELEEDIMKILTCYSARFYGARGGRKKKNKAENESDESNGI